MTKEPERAATNRAGLDLLRSLAAYPQHAVHLGKHRIESRIILIDRDHNGDVVRSTERIELTEYTNLEGDFLS